MATTEYSSQGKATRCLGSLLRRQKHWPPAVAAAPSAAGGLSKRTAWQPQSWQRLQLACLLAILLVSGFNRAEAAEEIRSGTLTFTADDRQSFEAPRLHTEVRMSVTGMIARVEVHQRFENPGDRWVEGSYAFPLPENSAVDRLRMTVGERVIVGEIREKVEAQKLYEQAKASGQAASLVQQHRANLFRTFCRQHRTA